MRFLAVCCLLATVVLAAENDVKKVQNPLRFFALPTVNSLARDNPGSYDPSRYDPGRYDPGRYNSRSDQSGRYIPDNSGAYNGDRGDRGGAYDGGYGDRGNRGFGGGYYTPEKQTTVVYQTIPPSTAAPATRAPTTMTTTTPAPTTKVSTMPTPTRPPTTAVPTTRRPPVQYGTAILEYKYDIDPIDRLYDYKYRTENKIFAGEVGNIALISNENYGTRVRGYYEYEGDDGLVYRVDYVADENGFQPIGAHIPQPRNVDAASL